MTDDERQHGDYDDQRRHVCTNCGEAGSFDHEDDVCDDCVRALTI